MRRRRVTRSSISWKRPPRSPTRRRARRRPDGSTRSTRARRTTRETGIRQRSIVGRRLGLDDAIRLEGDRLHASVRFADLRAVESIPVDRFAELAHFDPWWAFRGVSGVDRRWIEAIFSTNIARTFVRDHRTLKVHDLHFSEDLRTLEALVAKDDAFRPVEFHPREIDLRSLRRAPRGPREGESVGSAKAI